MAENKETITALIPWVWKHRELAAEAELSIKDQVDEVISRWDSEKIGQARMLNNMIEEVKTDWVLFQDADDRSYRWRVEECRPYMNKGDLLYTDYEYKDGFYFAGEFSLERLMKYNFIPFPTVMVRTHIAKEIPFPYLKMGGQDRVWHHMVYKKYKRFVYVPQVTIWYNTNTSSYRSRIPVYRKVKRLIKKYYVNRRINALYKTD